MMDSTILKDAVTSDSVAQADSAPSTAVGGADGFDSDLVDIIEALPLEVRGALIVGDDFWHSHGDGVYGIESIRVSDGPHGLRFQDSSSPHQAMSTALPATCFPSESTMACSFDEELLFEMGRALGKECRARGVSVLLGPGLNIKRHPLGGRNFEYFSEDPLLTGVLGAAYICGLEAAGVGACPKHFAANSQERARMVSDSLVDDRGLFEIYLRGFEIAVREGKPAAIMGAYNRLNGFYCCENRELLTEILRQRWGFDGAVISDWGAMSDPVASVAAGLSLCMPGPHPSLGSELAKAVQTGDLSEASLNAAALESLRLNLRYPTPLETTADKLDELFESHGSLACQAAEESAVLLTNDGVLPLDCKHSLAIIGALAEHPHFEGDGSSHVSATRVDSLLDGFDALGVHYVYTPGYDRACATTNDDLLAEAIAAAELCDEVVVVVGLRDGQETEGSDRTTAHLSESQETLIDRLCAANVRTVVVVQSGGVIEMPWREKPAALLWAGLGGQAGGIAIARLLAGVVNPSGKLAESWPISVEDTALGQTFPDAHRNVRYRESVYVGYRYYDAVDVEVAYPFGHGLSYTTFDYTDLTVDNVDGKLFAYCQVTNGGARAGAEVVQVYGGRDDKVERGLWRPPRALAGFQRVFLSPGQSRKITVELDARALAYWDRDRKGFFIEAGTYEIAVGSSSRDRRLRASIEFQAGERLIERFGTSNCGPLEVVLPADVSRALRALLTAYYEPRPQGFTDAAFKALYGKAEPPVPPKKPVTVNTTLGDLAYKPLGKFLVGLIHRIASLVLAGDAATRSMALAMLDDLPLRALTMSGMNDGQVAALVRFLNGAPLGGLGDLVRASLVRRDAL